jgi:hypothetical protein
MHACKVTPIDSPTWALCRRWLEAKDPDALGLLDSAHQLITGHLVRSRWHMPACMHAPHATLTVVLPVLLCMQCMLLKRGL